MTAAATPAVTLAPMRWWDIADVMAVEHELFGDEAWSDTMVWSELAQRDSRHYLVARSGDGSLLGYAGLCAYAPHEAYVQTMAVTAAAQGRGLGARLLDALLKEAQRQGCARVDLEVRADNPVAQRLYRSRGFSEIGVRRGYYQPSGTDAVVMRRPTPVAAAAG